MKPCARKDEVLWVAQPSSLTNLRTKEVFSFDNVFGADVTTKQIFQRTVRPIVEKALQGVNQTVFAYGQTSAGKTFTMRGGPKEEGLIPLSVREIFDCISQ